MNSKIKYWFARNGYKVTWFIVGWCALAGVNALFAGHLLSALFSFGLAYLNYILGSK